MVIPTVWTTPAMESARWAGQEFARDTVLVMVAPSGVANASEWGLFVLVVLASATVAALVWFLWRLDMHGRRLTAIARRFEDRSRPVLDRAAGVADNVDAITRSLRAETRHLTGSARALSDRLRQASTHMETRIDEFNALLEVVQAEVEELFLTTASAVRGATVGARAFDRRRHAEGSGHALDRDASTDGGEPGAAPELGARARDGGDEPPAGEGWRDGTAGTP